MSFNLVKKIPDPTEIKTMYPVPEGFAEQKAAFDKEVAKIFTGDSDKFLLVVGPCSADNGEAVLDYVERLRKVQEKVADKIIIIPRIYTNKPRTTGVGYKGMLHQPDPEKTSNLLSGLIAIRNLHLHVATQTGFMTADEMLYPENAAYLDDIVSYVAVGARSVENQQHRLVASAFDIPVGMKNPTSGDLSIMLNSVTAAQSEQEFIYRNSEIKTSGNPLTHTILRGATNKHGRNIPNYHYEDIMNLFNMYNERNLANHAVIIDTNHSNSNKQYMEQVRIAKEIMHNRQISNDIKSIVKGLMIESYIVGGCQKIGNGVYGQSITDPCLGWQDTKNLIYTIAELV